MEQEKNQTFSRADFLKLAGLLALAWFGITGCHRSPNDPAPDKKEDESDSDQFRQ